MGVTVSCPFESPGAGAELLAPGPHPRPTDQIAAGQPRHQDFLRAAQVILLCRQGWEPLT